MDLNSIFSFFNNNLQNCKMDINLNELIIDSSKLNN